MLLFRDRDSIHMYGRLIGVDGKIILMDHFAVAYDDCP